MLSSCADVHVYRSGLGRQIKERGIKVANILIEETRSLHVRGVEVIRSRMVVTVDVEPILGNLAPARARFGDKVPEFLGIGGTTGEATAHANDGDGDTGGRHLVCLKECRWGNLVEKVVVGLKTQSNEVDVVMQSC
jgi:hypothetical protein